jgi:hypothetical protein
MARLVNWRNGFWALLAATIAVTYLFIDESSDREVALRQCRTEAGEAHRMLTVLRHVAIDIARPQSRETFLEHMQRRQSREFPAILEDGSVYVGGLEFVFDGDRITEIRD